MQESGLFAYVPPGEREGTSMRKRRELHLISDGKRPLGLYAQLAGKLEPYVSMFHLREKNAAAKELYEGILTMRRAGVPPSKITVNDRADVALAAGVQAVQLPESGLDPSVVKAAFPALRVGKSVHRLQEAAEAERQGADYVLFGHVYPSSSKPGIPGKGTAVLREICRALDIPVIAIGGIRPENLREVIAAGAAGIAVMSGILDAPDPLLAAGEYDRQLREAESCE
jgi:thiazole tautomerase (transcriptional regulator TenI)